MNKGTFKTKKHLDFVKEYFDLGFKPLDRYQGTLTKVRFECRVCGSIICKTPSYLKTMNNQGKGCYNCWRTPILKEKLKNTIDRFAAIKNLKVKAYPADTAYDTKGTFYCASCDHTFKTSKNSLATALHCCPAFARRNFSKATKGKPYKLGCKTVYLEGYESQALDILLKEGWQPNEVVTQESGLVPTITYFYKGKVRKHYPDFYIPEENLIIEVKSNGTFGLNNKELFEKNKAKRKAAIKQGFRYEFIVIYQKGCSTKNNIRTYNYQENPLVTRWYDMSFSRFNKTMRASPFYVNVGDNFCTTA